MRYAGARGQLTVRADSGFYTHAVVALCRRMNVRFSITIRQRQSLHNLIVAIPEADWTPIPYWRTAPLLWPRPPTEPVSEVKAPNDNRSKLGLLDGPLCLLVCLLN